MTTHEPSAEAVRECLEALRIALNFVSFTEVGAERYELIARTVLRCAVEKCYYVPPGVVLKIGCDDADLSAAYWRERAERAEAECLEQARLLGMGGEREAGLIARAERAERGLAGIAQVLGISHLPADKLAVGVKCWLLEAYAARPAPEGPVADGSLLG